MEEEFNKKNYRILRFQLAFENYIANTGNDFDEFKNIDKKTHILWHESNNLSIKEKIILADDILDIYSKLFQSLTKEEQKRFNFYDDGNIDYTWDMNILK